MELLAGIIPPALGVALNPFPIIAVILLLSSPRAGSLGLGFWAGWAGGLMASVGLLVLLANLGGIGPNEPEPPLITTLIKLGVGLLLIVLAARKWLSKPGPDDEPSLPDWLDSLSSRSTSQIVGFGAMLSGVNPKNLMFNLVAAAAITGSGISAAGEVAAWLAYIVIASSLIVVPVGWYLINPRQAARALEGPRQWLVRHNSVLLAVMLLVIGAVLATGALAELR